ncbi:hypothetical protein BS47DRAFT_1340320 [Hydnum rufescens UP504]|uniref:SAM-dependent MTase RsmB/NOP-type domain-containing protein n=1 Tax=Hydnum rufescens UP504 TaxID=1448309 RepID=A0A9P6DW15_9AGAM|nr:hypothetical protein BS47DRAFT_1340320 [Hydnum rufescens UP504]
MTAAVIRTLEYKPVLTTIINATSLLKLERRHITSMNLALLLVHDLLFSRGGIQAGDGPIKQAILKHKTRLHSELVKIKVKRGVKNDKDLAQSEGGSGYIPRYVRINLNVGTLDEAISALATPRRLSLTEDRHTTNPKEFYEDAHIPGLLAFHPSISFQTEPLYLNGLLILQDKASCLPAALLSPPQSDKTIVIDATAAPGNKTSHLSSLMGNEGKIFAFERDKHRYATLQKMLKKAQCRNVETTCGDFLDTNPLDEKYRNVSHILLDPSCSGSGIVNRLDYLLESTENQEQDSQIERLQRLSEFQLSILQHAMKFPAAEKIVYSTCSIHPEENEHVVREALKSVEALQGDFHLAPRSQVMPTWERRGRSEEMYDPVDAESLIRTMPGVDRTNGFFVAVFVRGDSTSLDKSLKRQLDDDEVREAAGGKKPKKRRKKKKTTAATTPVADKSDPETPLKH